MTVFLTYFEDYGKGGLVWDLLSVHVQNGVVALHLSRQRGAGVDHHWVVRVGQLVVNLREMKEAFIYVTIGELVRMPLERAPQEEQNCAKFSFVAPSSEEL